MADNTYTWKEMVRYADLVARYTVAKFRYEREADSRLRDVLKKDLEEAYSKVAEYRELIGLTTR
jgi:hypothetical protein